ncbi:MAG: hypothetical protein ACYDAR_06220 [Thermomicrobiales bacterium]
MANAAIFIGWGPVIAGREQKALQVFNEVLQHYTQLQLQGEIESFEPVGLEPHGGDLSGFLLIRGDREKLSRLRASDEFQRLNTRGLLVVQNFGVVDAYIGEGLGRLFGTFQQAATELA